MAAQALWPLPNIGVANQVSNNYQTFVPSVSPFLKFFGRLDYNISDSNRLTFSITERDNPGIGYSSNCPSNCNPFDIDSRNIQLSDVWTITPRIVNEFRMAYTRQGNWYTPQSFGQGYPAKLNMPYAIQTCFRPSPLPVRSAAPASDRAPMRSMPKTPCSRRTWLP